MHIVKVGILYISLSICRFSREDNEFWIRFQKSFERLRGTRRTNMKFNNISSRSWSIKNFNDISIFTPLHKSLGSLESGTDRKRLPRCISNSNRHNGGDQKKLGRTFVYSNSDRQIHSTVEFAIPDIFCCFDFHHSRSTTSGNFSPGNKISQERKGKRKRERGRERNLKEIPYPFPIIPLYRKFDKISLSNGSILEWTIGGNRYRMFVILARRMKYER